MLDTPKEYIGFVSAAISIEADSATCGFSLDPVEDGRRGPAKTACGRDTALPETTVYAAGRARCRPGGPRVASVGRGSDRKPAVALKTSSGLKNRRIKARMFRAFRMVFYRCTFNLAG